MKKFSITKIFNYPGLDYLKHLSFTPIHHWEICKGGVPLAMLLSIAMVLSMGVLYFLNMVWVLYISTPMGQQFLVMHPGLALSVSDLLTFDLIAFSINLTLTSFIFCLLISVAFQLIYVLDYLYLPRNMLGRFILFGIPLAALVARHIQKSYGLEHWNIAFAVALFPTLFLFSGCFKFSHDYIPKIGGLITDGAQIVRKILKFII